MIIRRLKDTIKGLYWIYYSSKGFHKIENNIKEKYYNEKNTQQPLIPSVVFMIDGRYIHGGLSDRLRGIVSIYGYCKQHNIPFYLHHVYPFQLTDYMLPNSYDWRIEEKSISYDRDKVMPVMINDFQLIKDLHKLYLNKILKKSKQIHIYSNAYFLDNQFSKLFLELFKPTDDLQRSIDENIKNIGGDYTAMVFRFQQLLGDFKETGYKTLANDEQKQLIQKCLNKINELYLNNSNSQKILVTSDSKTFLDEANKFEFVYTIPGQVVHMDHTEDANYENYKKSFVDLFVIANAKKIYMMKTDDMFHSGFPKRAAMIYDKQFENFIF